MAGVAVARVVAEELIGQGRHGAAMIDKALLASIAQQMMSSITVDVDYFGSGSRTSVAF